MSIVAALRTYAADLEARDAWLAYDQAVEILKEFRTQVSARTLPAGTFVEDGKQFYCYRFNAKFAEIRDYREYKVRNSAEPWEKMENMIIGVMETTTGLVVSREASTGAFLLCEPPSVCPKCTGAHRPPASSLPILGSETKRPAPPMQILLPGISISNALPPSGTTAIPAAHQSSLTPGQATWPFPSL